MGASANPNMVQPMNRTTGFSSMEQAQQSLQQPQNPFQQAAAAQTDAMGMARGGANMVNNATNYLGSGANMIGAGSNMIGTGANVVGGALGALNPAANRVNQGMTQTAADGMSTYQNPYEDQVVQASMRDIGNQGLKMQNTLGAQAQAAGAFGGSRHGIAEAELAKGTQQQMLDQAARLRAQGFNTALGASQADRAAQLGAAGQSAGIAGQAAGMGGQISGMGSAMGGLGSQMGGLGSTMGNLGSTASGIGTNLSNMGQTSFGYGNTIADRQARDGAMQQGLMQQLINAAKGQYGNYANAPMNKLQLPLAALGAAPVPQTQTQDRQLGIMDYLTAGASFATGMPSFMG
tara:strand:+ start:585 stop:1628 length:1044 start_codon:yes stop_codon:yes gene_type:complete